MFKFSKLLLFFKKIKVNMAGEKRKKLFKNVKKLFKIVDYVEIHNFYHP